MSAAPTQPPGNAAGEESGLVKGATIGRYVVLGLLGRGGMGEVYAAYDPELDRKIAVKLLRARAGGVTDSDGRTRLLREAQAIARLSHPNVVVVYDVGTFRESVFIAMEFVEGHTLGYWLEAAPRRWREVLDVYLAAGRGLVAAHAAGLVHRDFKPDNVMITKSGQVRVMDFGLARDQNAEDGPSPAGQLALEAGARAAALADTFGPDVDPDATAKLGTGGTASQPVPAGSGGYLRLKLTQTGALLGTPAYMAPEQFAGTGGDARSDQFSFCVAVYEGVYGRRPFAGDNAVALMANVVAGTISEPPPEARVPAWIRKVLLRGLSANPKARFASMTDLLVALGQDPAARRRRWLAAATFVAFVAAGAAGAHRITAGQRAMCAGGPGHAASAWNAERRAAMGRAFFATGNKNAARALGNAATLVDQYIARWTGMYTDTCEATQVRGEQSGDVLDLRMTCLGERLSSVRALSDVFSAADTSVVENAVGAASALPALDPCADVAMLRAVIKQPDDPNVRAKVAAARERVARVNALASSGQCEKAALEGRSIVAEATEIKYRPLEAEALFAVGRLGASCTDPAQSVSVLEQAFLKAEAANHDEVAVEASDVLAGDYADRIPDPHLSRLWAEHAEAILSRFPGHPVLEAWLAGARADSFHAEGQAEAALQEDRHALTLKEAALGRTNVDTLNSMVNVALRLHELGRDEEAVVIGDQAIKLLREALGESTTVVALALANQSEYLAALHRFGPAHAALEEALSVWRESDASPYFTGFGLLDLGRLELAEGRPKSARTTLEKSVALLGQSDARSAAEAKFALAQALWSSPRDRSRALDLSREARAVIRKASAASRQAAEIDHWIDTHSPG